MANPKTWTITVALALLINSGIARAEDKVDLKLRLDKGDKITQRITTRQEVQMEMMGTPQETKTDTTIEYTLEVEDKDESGTLSVAYTYDVLKFEQKNPMGPSESYDSTNPEAATGMIAKTFAALLDQTLTMKIHPDGSVTDVQGVEALLNRITGSLDFPDPAIKQMVIDQLDSQFGAAGMKQMMEQALGFLPDEPVGKGDSWTHEVKVPGPLPIILITKYKVKGIRDGMVILDVSGAVKKNAEPGVIEMGPMKMQIELSGTQSGTMSLNQATGMVRESALKQEFTGTMTPTGMPGDIPPGMEMPMTIESTVRLEEVDK